MDHYLNNIETALQCLNTSEAGLPQAEAQKRIPLYGKQRIWNRQ